MVLLQLSPPDLPNWVRVVSQASSLLTGLIGLGIVYLAWKGYRRHDSRPMFYLAVGFILAIGLPFVLFVPLLVLPSPPQWASIGIALFSRVSTLVGLLCILYSIRLPR